MRIDSLKHDLSITIEMIDLINKLHFIENATEISSSVKNLKKDLLVSIREEENLLNNSDEFM